MTDNFDFILPSDMLDEITANTAEDVSRQVWTDIRTVKLGRSDKSTVGVPLSESKNKSEVYFTEIDDTGTGTCINTKTEWLRNLQVKIGHPPDDKDRWHVQDIVIQNELEPVTTQPGVPPHSEQHGLRNVGYDGSTVVGKAGSDILFIDDRQMWQLAILPYSGWQARIVGGWVMFNGESKYYNGAILADQTSNVPAGAGDAAYVLVELDSDLTLTYTKGTEFEWQFPGVDGFSQYVPTGADNTYKWVLLVRNGQTEFTYANLWPGQHFRQVHAPPIISVASSTNTSGPGIYEVDTTGGAVTLTLASSDAVAGRRIVIKDVGGNAGTNNITIATEGAETINDDASIVIIAPFGSATPYSDGSNWYTLDYGSGIGANLAADTLHIGNTTDYLSVDSSGYLQLFGEATVWDDLRVPISSTKTGGSSDPDFSVFRTDGAGSQGVFAYFFNKTVEEELYFSVQMPHNWKIGSTIYPHVHWSPASITSGGNVVWGLEYTWSNINGTFDTTTILTTTDSAGTTAYAHLLKSWASIDGTGKTHSSMLICRVFRKAGDAADTFDDDAALLEVDFHYEIDAIGEDTRPGAADLLLDSDGDQLLDSDGNRLTESDDV